MRHRSVLRRQSVVAFNALACWRGTIFQPVATRKKPNASGAVSAVMGIQNFCIVIIFWTALSQAFRRAHAPSRFPPSGLENAERNTNSFELRSTPSSQIMGVHRRPDRHRRSKVHFVRNTLPGIPHFTPLLLLSNRAPLTLGSRLVKTAPNLPA